jgi:hypothetical protein
MFRRSFTLAAMGIMKAVRIRFWAATDTRKRPLAESICPRLQAQANLVGKPKT